MKIILFRHGEKQEREETFDTEVNRSICMSAKGIIQMEELAQNLYFEHPDFVGLKYIYSSPYPRTIQSAEIVRRILNIKEVKTVVLLKELYAFNDYRIPKEKQKGMHQYALENLDYKNESGYSYGERAEKALEFLKKLYTENNKNVLVSCHGGLIRGIVLSIDKGENTRQYLESRMPEGGYVQLEFNGEIFTIISAN